MTRLVFLALASALSAAACSNPDGPSGPPLQLAANVVDPATVNAVSKFHSCVGHPFPEQNSPNSGKNYFWPASPYTSTTNQLPIYAACDGTISQPMDDTDDTSAIALSRGKAFHLSCDRSSTGVRYQEITFDPAIVGQRVKAGDAIAYADLLGTNESPATTWQFSSNFDIAVYNGNDADTEDYFEALGPSAFAAWAARGVTAVAQTVNGANPACAAFNSNVGQPDIVVFTPSF